MERMEKLDENYLDLVRNSLYAGNISKPNLSAPLKSNNPKKDSSYNSLSVSNKKIDNEIRVSSNKARKVKVFVKGNRSEKKINRNKHRVSTPPKIKSVPNINTVKTSPGLISDSEPDISKNRGKKRRLSISDSPVITKKLKQKSSLAKPKAEHTFDKRVENREITGTELKKDQFCSKQGNKTKKKLRKKRINQTNGSCIIQVLQRSNRLKTNSTPKPSLSGPDGNGIVKIVNSNKKRNTGEGKLNGFSDLCKSLTRGSAKNIDVTKLSGSHVNTNTKTKDKFGFIVSLVDNTDKSENTPLNGICKPNAADFYDNDKLTVKKLKFLRFANLFQPTLCEYHIKPSNFSVPKKHYKMSETDQIEWQYEWIVSEPEEPALYKTYATRTPILNKHSTNDTEEYIPDTPSKSFEDSASVSNDIVEISLDSRESSPTTSPVMVINLNDSSKVVILTDINQVVHFHGFCFLKVLQGKIEILGAILDKNSVEQKVYSPRGTSLLYIRNYNKLYSKSNIELKTLISSDLLNGDDISLSFAAHSVILYLRELKEHYINFIESSISQVLFMNNICKGPRVNFEVKGLWNKTRYCEQWQEALENLPDLFKMVVCGGKGVGKSTFLRYCVNFLLRRFRKIRVIDLDPGQSEFHPPGSISVATIDGFILGPNYTHLQNADRLILAHINIGQNINQYLKSVKFLLDAASSMKTLPTIVNFHGFNLGIGLDISANQIKMIKPTHLFEIRSKNQKKNYKIDMTAELINNFIKTSVLNLDIDLSDELDYVYVKLTSMAGKNEAWSLEARQSRELCLLAYFGKMMSDEVKDLTSPGVNMYSINVTALTFTNYEGRIISPLSVNNNIVALCSMDHHSNQMFLSYGYGLVRGLDLETDTLVLVTPHNIETLEKVTHLVLGLATPPPFIMVTGAGKGHIPYVNVGDLVDLGQLTKRSYIPVK